MQSKKTAGKKYKLSDQESKTRLNTYSNHLTLGVLLERCKEMIETMPADTIILVERVEDTYYDEHGWDQFMSPDPRIPDEYESLHPAWSITTNFDGNYPVIRLHY